MVGYGGHTAPPHPPPATHPALPEQPVPPRPTMRAEADLICPHRSTRRSRFSPATRQCSPSHLTSHAATGPADEPGHIGTARHAIPDHPVLTSRAVPLPIRADPTGRPRQDPAPTRPTKPIPRTTTCRALPTRVNPTGQSLAQPTHTDEPPWTTPISTSQRQLSPCRQPRAPHFAPSDDPLHASAPGQHDLPYPAHPCDRSTLRIPPDRPRLSAAEHATYRPTSLDTPAPRKPHLSTVRLFASSPDKPLLPGAARPTCPRVTTPPRPTDRTA